MRSKHATWRPVPYRGLHARTPRRAVILHTNGGGTDNGSLFGWWSAGARGEHGPDNLHVGAHFQVMLNGDAEQYVDTDLVVYHAYSASEWAVAIETEDDGTPATPWTNAQLDTIIAICRELNVPGQLLKDGPSDGIGWHEQYADWNKSGHRCPGSVRERQIHDVILPALAAKPLSVPWWWRRTLRPGMSGPDVFAAKRRLSRLGYRGLSLSPNYGPAVEHAVRIFQGSHRLPSTGAIDRATAHAIRIA